MRKLTYTSTDNNVDEKPVKKYTVIGCNNCHRTDRTLIKATDSYYCKECFIKLKKEKFKKKGN